jgi:1-acyl-sn-glycerol-3-phosphate acyltransferase
MVYYFVKYLVGLAARIYFKKIHLHQKEKIDFNKPTIFSANHPNAFLDAMVIGSLTPRKMYYIVRGDIFNTPLKRWLLSLLNMYPIYRTRDGLGFSGLKQNNDMFDFYKKILSENGCILIFTEGLGVLEKRLRPLQKGTAKLAIDFATSHPNGKNLQIIPMGINYTKMVEANGEFMWSLDTPIHISEYMDKIHQDRVKTINELTGRIGESLIKNVIHINDKEDDILVEHWLEINRNETPSPTTSSWIIPNKATLDVEIQAAKVWNELKERDIQLFITWRDKISQYAKLVQKNDWSDKDLKKQPFLWKNLWIGLIGLPLLIWSMAVHFIPVSLALAITKKVVRKKEFIASIKMASMLFLSLFWYLLLGGILHLIFGFKIALIATLIHYPILLVSKDILYSWQHVWAYLSIRKNNEVYKHLSEKRKQILLLPYSWK